MVYVYVLYFANPIDDCIDMERFSVELTEDESLLPAELRANVISEKLQDQIDLHCLQFGCEAPQDYFLEDVC